MKKIFSTIIPAVAVALALASCNSVMDDKAEIDSKHAIGNLPAVAVTGVVESSTSVALTGAVSDISNVIEVGVRVSESEDMSNASYSASGVLATEFTAVAGKLNPSSTYYVQAYAMMGDNSMAVSDVKAITTLAPAALSVKSLNGQTFVGGVVAYWGDEYSYSVSLDIDPADSTKVTVKNLDPYFASNGYVAEVGRNIFSGVIDWKNEVITIEAGQLVGYNDVYILGFNDPDPDAADDYDDIYLDIKNYGESLVIRNAFGVSSDAGWYELYPGGTTLVKK